MWSFQPTLITGTSCLMPRGIHGKALVYRSSSDGQRCPWLVYFLGSAFWEAVSVVAWLKCKDLRWVWWYMPIVPVCRCGGRGISSSSSPVLPVKGVWGQHELCEPLSWKAKPLVFQYYFWWAGLDNFPLFPLVKSPVDAPWLVLECSQFKWKFHCALFSTGETILV